MRISIALAALVLGAACGGDSSTAPTPGGGDDATISVRVSTTLLPGATPDPDGYSVFVDGEAQTVDLDATATFSGVPSGERRITISGLSGNCAVSCGRQRRAQAQAGQTVTEMFEVSCAPPPEGRIAFSSNRSGNGEEIYVIGADGSGLTRLTHDATPSMPNLLPRWSPDGSKILHGRENSDDIWVMNADGSGMMNLTDHPAGDFGAGYSWSPDGSQIVFGSDRDDPLGAIYVMNADGSDQRMIANEPGGECCMDWSPDGTTIAFTIGTLSSGEIHLMEADGGNIRFLTPGGSTGSANPSWSPESDQLLFNRDRGLHTILVDGSCDIPLQVDGLHPTWSPDGFYIAYTGADGVYIANFDGSNPKNLTGPVNALDRMPSWTR